VSKNSNRVLEYDGQSGAWIGTVVDLASLGMSIPVDLVFGPNDRLYVSLSGDESVARVDVATGAASAFVTSRSGGLDSPAGLRFHPYRGSVLVVSQGTNSVLEYDGATGDFFGVFATGFTGDSLFFLAFRP